MAESPEHEKTALPQDASGAGDGKGAADEARLGDSVAVGYDDIAIIPKGQIDPVYEAKARVLNRAIQEMGMGWYQWQLFIVVGFGWASDNLWPIVTSLILTPVGNEFRPTRLPLLTLSQNIGLLAGAIFWGFGCDIFGRRWAFNLTLGLTALWGLVAAGSPSFAAIGVFDAFWSFGVGGNLPVDSAIFLEFLPQSHQFLLTILSLDWSLAQVIATLVAWPLLGNLTCQQTDKNCTKGENMGWRYFLIAMGGLTLVMFFIRFVLFKIYESPKYLVGKGLDEKAVEVVHKVAKLNNKTTTLTIEDLRACEPDGYVFEGSNATDAIKRHLEDLKFDRVKALFATGRLALSTGMIMAVWALIGLAYPLYNAFIPYIQASRGVSFGDGSTYITYRNSLIIAVLGVPGALLGGFLVELPRLGRKGTLSLSTVITGVFLYGSTTAKTSNALLGWNCAFNFTSNIMYAVLYGFTPELFPTPQRGTGNALTATCNRVFGIMAPIVAMFADLSTSSPVYASGALFIAAVWIPVFDDLQTPPHFGHPTTSSFIVYTIDLRYRLQDPVTMTTDSSPKTDPRRVNTLCSQCSKVDFRILFQPDFKSFKLGTLSSIAQNKTCPLCSLVLKAVNTYWRQWAADKVDFNSCTHINFCIKTNFWAHAATPYEVRKCSLGLGNIQLLQSRLFRFRPVLGTDWIPDERLRSYRSSPIYTLCSLDRVPTGEFSTFPSDPGTDRTQTLQRRLIPEVVNIPLIQAWIRECCQRHGHYKDRAASQSELRATGKFRVIDVVNSCLIEPTQLIDYIALSYVWGDSAARRKAVNPTGWWNSFFAEIGSLNNTPRFRRLRLGRLGNRKNTPQVRRLRLDQLPVTIRDAIDLVRSLDWRYVWADMLCIRQDDALDQEVLVKKMHHVYEGASFTVVAAGGDNAESPLPGLRKGTRIPESAHDIPTNHGVLKLALATRDLKSILSSLPWNTRAWTFQEDLLSACCLFFSPGEVFYSCQHNSRQHELPPVHFYKGFVKGRFSEYRESYVLETRDTLTAYQCASPWHDMWIKGPTYGLRSEAKIICPPSRDDQGTENQYVLNPFDFAPPPPSAVDFREYASFVREYTRRRLTHHSDTVQAFIGILSKFGAESQLGLDAEFHGLLEAQFEMALLWTSNLDVSLVRRRISATNGAVIRRYSQFPSWAWAGWDGPVEYLVDRDPMSEPLVGPSASSHHSHDHRWVFWPVTFLPKSGSLKMTRSFRFSSTNNDGRLVCWLLEVEDRAGQVPNRPSTPRDSLVLTIFTYVAKVRLESGNSFVAREYDNRYGVPCVKIHSSEGSRGTAALLDSRSLIEHSLDDPDMYRLVAVGRGHRRPPANAPVEWVVLVVKRQGDCWERIGLTTIRDDSFTRDLQWINLA
ncbi:uncharacterized protein E0L32_002203 [Thyridium curvatum]|uniref:Major facilitator superfamily (MFS) profile domain-containing protein n=1 Tax=Thyridium curvatum TaxID=1093900 RepID=A0A507AIY0_9PEZI|nr:uncharacterized protein E0L32_002203 [Thyridium curvatum]TPX06707.1 hypothetical protein E0L32_002203 [Thyridium curvatum]